MFREVRRLFIVQEIWNHLFFLFIGLYKLLPITVNYSMSLYWIITKVCRKVLLFGGSMVSKYGLLSANTSQQKDWIDSCTGALYICGTFSGMFHVTFCVKSINNVNIYSSQCTLYLSSSIHIIQQSVRFQQKACKTM